MQEVSKAVFSIEQNDTSLVTESGVQWGGQTWTDAVRRMENLKECFEELSKRLSLLE